MTTYWWEGVLNNLHCGSIWFIITYLPCYLFIAQNSGKQNKEVTWKTAGAKRK